MREAHFPQHIIHQASTAGASKRSDGNQRYSLYLSNMT
jgi:hypothetical protein